MDYRLQLLTSWARNSLKNEQAQIVPLAGDASFRRYFRAHTPQKTYVLMDAPPERESISGFLAIANAYTDSGIVAPSIINFDETQGFILMSDLGDDLLLGVLNFENADRLYTTALETLAIIQTCHQTTLGNLPRYDESFILRELQLLPEWFLEKHLQISYTPAIRGLFEKLFQNFATMMTQQPQVGVHRDYHSRNLLWLPSQKIGVLDFQDAVIGPIGYDPASLLRDCYINWPETKVEQWLRFYYEILNPKDFSFAQLTEWFDWCSLQRHLRVLGTFSRLNLRDQKPQYLESLPRMLNYILLVCDRYPDLKDLKLFLEAEICNRVVSV